MEWLDGRSRVRSFFMLHLGFFGVFFILFLDFFKKVLFGFWACVSALRNGRGLSRLTDFLGYGGHRYRYGTGTILGYLKSAEKWVKNH